MVCLDHRSVLQNLVNKISSLNFKTTDTSVQEIIKTITFIHELVDLDKKILSPATVFNTLLIDLTTSSGFEQLITAYKKSLLT